MSCVRGSDGCEIKGRHDMCGTVVQDQPSEEAIQEAMRVVDNIDCAGQFHMDEDMLETQYGYVAKVLDRVSRAREAQALERAARVVDWYFTTYFSKSPGSKAVDELMAAIRALVSK